MGQLKNNERKAYFHFLLLSKLRLDNGIHEGKEQIFSTYFTTLFQTKFKNQFNSRQKGRILLRHSTSQTEIK